MTTYEKHTDPTKLCAHIQLPSEEKRKLPAPEILSAVYQDGKDLCIDIKDHEGNCWTLASNTYAILRRALRYFKMLDRDLIEQVLPRGNVPMKNWKVMKGILCAKCGKKARRNPTAIAYGCTKCEHDGPLGELFVVRQPDQPKKPKPPSAVPGWDSVQTSTHGVDAIPKAKAKDKPKPESKPVEKRKMTQTTEPKPLAGLSLKDRLAAKRKAAE